MRLPWSQEKDDLIHEAFPRIDATIAEALEYIGEALPGGAVIVDHPLGCGSWGCAFPTRTPHGRWAVKITGDELEAATTWVIINDDELRLMPGIALLEGMWRLPAPEKDLFVILREEITPTRGIGYEMNHAIVAYTDALSEFDRGREMHEEDPSWGFAKAVFQESQATLETAEERAGQHHQLDEVVRFIQHFYELTGAPLQDFGEQNLGLRTHDMSAFAPIPYHQEEGSTSEYLVALETGRSMQLDEPTPGSILMENPGRIPVIR